MEPMKPMQPMKPMEPMKPMKPMEPMQAEAPWWPAELGQPDSSGSQNSTRYAYFANAHRLVVDRDGAVTTYDTGPHRIDGFGQQQSGTSEMTFRSEAGPITLDTLHRV